MSEAEMRRALRQGLAGRPLLRADGNGSAVWTKENALSQWQKGTGWQAKLTGGLQTGSASWGGLFIPYMDMKIPDFYSADWSWLQTQLEEYGVNIVIWAQDPTNRAKRVEITQSASNVNLAKAAGWNSHAFDIEEAQMFWYGEGVVGSGLLEGAANLYSWADFQADVIFKDWVIYRVSLEHGWYSTGTFEPVWVVELKLNGEIIPIMPPELETLGDEVVTVQRYPFGKGSLTTDGVQYSTEITGITESAFDPIEAITFQQPIGSVLEEIEFLLEMEVKSSSTVKHVKWKFQASDNGSDWEDLIAVQIRAADASVYAVVAASGKFAPTGNFLGKGATFQVRGVIQAEDGVETVSGKHKNTSYVTGKYRRA